MKRALAALLVVQLGQFGQLTEARANIWADAIAQSAPDPSKQVYEKAMRDGDDHVLLANIESSARAERRRQVQNALDAYRRAAAARPTEAEPYFRIGATLNSFYLDSCFTIPQLNYTPSPLRDCRSDTIDPVIAQQTIDAWTAAEARAPLDPRFSASEGESVLFDRAILHTKLGTKQSLEEAARDYERYLERSDGKNENIENAWSNLAETYMMLGRLEDSINAYRELPYTAEVSTIYGAAVALDRDERGELAKQLILAQGASGFATFRLRVERGDTFFVPTGEKFYYYALAEETFGRVDAAIGYWRQYIGSGAHPQFHPRAKQHIDALLLRKRARPSSPVDPFLDMR
ncbi:MAG: hypothetical protein H0T89_08625 [Deltaproteobacteria bacterium]|nr:hypothetical protein [Deltaproteobacteria bacterium]MDQ3301001.1 hypothetical protein [Myxococcota bacterium]